MKKTHPYPEKKTSGPLKHHVTQIQQLRGKLQVFNISNR